MRTFQENDCLGNIPNAEIYWQLFEYAKSKGVPVYKYQNAENFDTWPNIFFSSKNHLCSIVREPSSRHTLITFEQFFEYCDNWSKCQPAKIKLNDEYTAEIQDGKVKVGCKYFTFEAIEELYKATKQ